MTVCKECGEEFISIHGIPDRYNHRCQKLFEYRFEEDDPNDWRECRGWSSEDAATRLAEKFDRDSGDGPSDHMILIRTKGGTYVATIKVVSEPKIVYRSTMLSMSDPLGEGIRSFDGDYTDDEEEDD